MHTDIRATKENLRDLQEGQSEVLFCIMIVENSELHIGSSGWYALVVVEAQAWDSVKDAQAKLTVLHTLIQSLTLSWPLDSPALRPVAGL